jgi:hypothetical protein
MSREKFMMIFLLCFLDDSGMHRPSKIPIREPTREEIVKIFKHWKHHILYCTNSWYIDFTHDRECLISIFNRDKER